jgi:hypothetical protein
MEMRLVEPQSCPISRRTLLSLALAAPMGVLPPNRPRRRHGYFPVSVERCVVVSQGRDPLLMARNCVPEGLESLSDLFSSRPSSAWRCEIVHAVGQHLVRDWWLLISQSQNRQPSLTVIQPSSAVPQNASFLAARITFRLHVLKRRGFALGGFNKVETVRMVNQQILRALDGLPS